VLCLERKRGNVLGDYLNFLGDASLLGGDIADVSLLPR